MNIREQLDTLQSEIDQKRQEIRSDHYSMSIGEWISLYQQGEIEIHPEFQRFFRWSDYQKTKLIESILLGIPIPPIFVSQREDGIWDVVDGLQRLSTIYQFLGILKDEDGKTLLPFTLQKTEYLPSLAGKIWEDKEHSEGSIKGFTPTQRLLIKRAKIDVNILLKESDIYAKYELFQRLNTGGSIATSQELRSCILVSLNPNRYRWIKQLSANKNFQSCIALNEKSLEEQYDIEILCRFLVLRKIDESVLNKIIDVDNFFTEKIKEIANNTSYNLEEEQAAFEKTFLLLGECLAGDSFRKYDVNKQKFSGGFLLAPFETIALGIGYNYQQYNATCSDMRNKIVEIWSNEVTETNKATVFTQVANFMLTQMNQRSLIPYEDAVSTASNLTSSILCEIVCILGLDYSFYKTKEVIINEQLLKRRNGIAHGEYLLLDRGEYQQLHDEILEMMENFRTQIENNASQKLYLRNL